MKILDKYILRTLLSTFFFVVVILLAVITVIDLTEKMDKFAKAGVTSGQIADYYLDYISWIGSFITPITMFIATVYVCARMAGGNSGLRKLIHLLREVDHGDDGQQDHHHEKESAEQCPEDIFIKDFHRSVHGLQSSVHIWKQHAYGISFFTGAL